VECARAERRRAEEREQAEAESPHHRSLLGVMRMHVASLPRHMQNCVAMLHVAGSVQLALLMHRQKPGPRKQSVPCGFPMQSGSAVHPQVFGIVAPHFGPFRLVAQSADVLHSTHWPAKAPPIAQWYPVWQSPSDAQLIAHAFAGALQLRKFAQATIMGSLHTPAGLQWAAAC
jgi:hypothetical protein